MRPPPPPRLHLFPGLVSLLCLVGLPAAHAALPSMLDAPIVDFRLALFDDQSGRKTSDLRGKTAVYLGSEQVEIRDFTLTLLNRRGDHALVVASPKASLQIKTRIATGDDTIHVEGPGYALDGKRWQCDEPTRKIAIREGAKVTFEATLIDILK